MNYPPILGKRTSYGTTIPNNDLSQLPLQKKQKTENDESSISDEVKDKIELIVQNHMLPYLRGVATESNGCNSQPLHQKIKKAFFVPEDDNIDSKMLHIAFDEYLSQAIKIYIVIHKSTGKELFPTKFNEMKSIYEVFKKSVLVDLPSIPKQNLRVNNLHKAYQCQLRQFSKDINVSEMLKSKKREYKKVVLRTTIPQHL